MYNQDLITVLGLRTDGRRSNEIRQIKCKAGINTSVEGSAYFKIGLTEVICFVNGPKEASNKSSQRLMNVEYSIAPFAGTDHRKISKSNKYPFEWSEFAENLCISFEDIICTEVYPKCEINLLVTIIQSDGATKSAIFNAICLALLDAGIAMKDFMVSCSTGILNNECLLDLTYNESNNCNGELIISYTPKNEKINFMELKNSKTQKADFDKLLKTNIEGCKQIYDYMRQYVKKYSLRKIMCSIQLISNVLKNPKKSEQIHVKSS